MLQLQKSNIAHVPYSFSIVTLSVMAIAFLSGSLLLGIASKVSKITLISGGHYFLFLWGGGVGGGEHYFQHKAY